MSECINASSAFICLLCGVVGPLLLIAGGVIYATADCEVLEVVNVTSLVKVPQGIGLCAATFEYSAGPGELVFPCPYNMTLYVNNSVAVCYPVTKKQTYTAALTRESLVVRPHSIPLSLLISGAIVTALPMTVAISSLLQNFFENRKYDARDDVRHNDVARRRDIP